MAWIRTSLSLITFGFTIFKFFEYLATSERRRRCGTPLHRHRGMAGHGDRDRRARRTKAATPSA
jgi:uncharacterized protein DUF202